MFEVLRRFGLGENFINWVKLLYKKTTASFLTNGLLSTPFGLSRGTAQGSPLSPLLFSLAIEPLAIAIRQSNDIKGILIGKKVYKILLYADDILLTLTDPVKSIPGEPNFIKPFRWAPTGLKYLGIHITPRTSQLYSGNINPIITHIKDRLLKWKKLSISFLGRVNLIKMIILPKLIYPVSMLYLFFDSKDLARINKAISEFIWAGRKPKIKIEVLQLPRTLGGWGLPKVENYVLSIHARNISLWAIQKNTNPCERPDHGP
uniref:Reverse transcriptase domain-containing protein n=1 Tax=Cyprinodon variegatus TaxID=28743 RepID=A0A3Q2D9Y0_CYPVA